MSIKLTLGLSFYNNEQTLLLALNSILMQSYSSWELILIDDGSTDRSYQIASDFAKNDERIHLISDGQNKGLANRLNQIIDLAEGEYIGRMDSDDMMLPLRLEKQMNFLISNPTIDVIDSSIYVIDEFNEPYGYRGKALERYSIKSAVRGSILYHPTVIAKASWYKKNKYAEGYLRSEDHELWCRSTSQTKFIRINEPLLLYREGKVNVNNYRQSMASTRKILRKYGPDILSGMEMTFELLNTHFKNVAYSFMDFFGWQRVLSSTRNKPITKEQKEYIRKTIKQIESFRPAI
jgi:glycosyltransferase involved in cell wall biosynthesis